MVAYTALGRTRQAIVAYPVPGEHFNRTVIHLNREIYG